MNFYDKNFPASSSFFPHLDAAIAAHEPKAKYDSIAAEETPTNP